MRNFTENEIKTFSSKIKVMKLLTSLFLSTLSVFLFGQTYEAKSYVVNEEEHHSISKFLPLSNGDYLLNIHRYCNNIIIGDNVH